MAIPFPRIDLVLLYLAFHLLDERIQRFIWAEGWESLRDAQETAIPLIVKGDRDVIVAAATAAGKTEAAFLPALTHLVQADTPADTSALFRAAEEFHHP